MTAGSDQTFLFADLAGYSALTERRGDEFAADLALGFCAALNRHLPRGAEDLKSLGDACLVRAGDAGSAIELALNVVEEIERAQDFPGVRIGIHTGSAVQRGRDWFGSAVNIAARIVDLAGAGEVLLSDATRVSAGDLPGISFDSVGPRDLRNIGRTVAILRARRA